MTQQPTIRCTSKMHGDGVKMRCLMALESQRTQGDCRGGYKTLLTETEVYYSPAEEDIRLRDIFPSSAGILQPD